MAFIKYCLVVFIFILLTTSLSLAEDTSPSDLIINGKTVPPVVAVVNGVDLPIQFLENQIAAYRMQVKQKGMQLTPADEEAFAHDALDRMIEQEILYQKRKELGLKADPEKVNKEIERIASQFPSKELFLNALSVQRLDMALLKNSISKKFIDDEFLRKKIAPNVKVPKDAVSNYYNANIVQFEKPERYTIKHIFVSALESPPHARKDASPAIRKRAEKLQQMIFDDAKAKINQVHKKLKAGGSFEKLAKEFSEDSNSKDKGGLLGDVVPRTVFPAMSAWLPRLKAGEYSDPIKTPLGYHIMKMEARLPKETVPLKDVESDILNHLLKQELEVARDAELKSMKAAAKIQQFF